MSPIVIEDGFEYKLKEEIDSFEADMKRCLGKVTYGFPELSNVKFGIRINPFSQDPVSADFIIEYRTPLGPILKDCIISCNFSGMDVLSDDDCKEGALAHELGEISHQLKKSYSGIGRTRRWENENKYHFMLGLELTDNRKGRNERYKDLVQKHADLTAARRGYGHKLIKTLTAFQELPDGRIDNFHLKDRIRNLEGYLKR